MKKILVIVAIAFSTAFSYWNCRVIDRGFFRCDDYEFDNSGMDTSHTEIFVRMKNDGGWMIKAFLDNGERVVTGKCKKVSIDEDVARNIRNGKRVDESDLDSALNTVVESYEPVSVMKCPSPDMVVTFKFNGITGLRTDRREYKNLKPGTYCEDFVATDALYWKP